MPTFKLFLAVRPKVVVPPVVLEDAGKQLKGYFDRICMMPPRKFSNATYKIHPTAGEVGDQDLLVYLTYGSFIVEVMDKLEPGIPHQLPAGHIGGGTKKMPDGSVLSEVYYTGSIGALKSSTDDKRGNVLAKLIFHEWVHNKLASDPTALAQGEINGDYVHHYCGGGVLSAGLSYGLMVNTSINGINLNSMARVLHAQNKQNLSGL